MIHVNICIQPMTSQVNHNVMTMLLKVTVTTVFVLTMDVVKDDGDDYKDYAVCDHFNKCIYDDDDVFDHCKRYDNDHDDGVGSSHKAEGKFGHIADNDKHLMAMITILLLLLLMMMIMDY